MYAKPNELELAERVHPLLVLNDVNLLTYLDTRLAIRGQWYGYFELVLMASCYGIDVAVFMATSPIGGFSALEFLQSRHQNLEEFCLDRHNCPGALLYHHQYQRPLTPVANGHDYRLNHF